MQERWLPVPGFEGAYEISDQGKLKSLSRKLRSGRTCRERMITGTPNSNGRLLVVLQQNCKKRTCFIYQLVAEAFLGPYPEGHCVNHKNGDYTDDRLENLEYATHKGNSRHAADVLHSYPLGEAHPLSKLTVSDVREIRALWATGKWKQRNLASKYGVTQRAIWQVIHRHTWKHI